MTATIQYRSLTMSCFGDGGAVVVLLLCLQADMFDAAKQRYDSCLEQVTSWDAFMAALNNKHMVLAPWADEVAVSDGRCSSLSEIVTFARTGYFCPLNHVVVGGRCSD